MSPKIVLITGASSGVGLATAKALLTTPHSSSSPTYHILLSSRTLSQSETAASTLTSSLPPSSPHLITPLALDVTSPHSLSSAYAYISTHFPHLDALINNAAVGGTHIDNLYERYKLVMETNVVGAAAVADTFRPLLLRAEDPYSVFVSSGAGSFSRAIERMQGTRGKAPEPRNGGAYHVSKAALNMLALREFAQFGVGAPDVAGGEAKTDREREEGKKRKLKVFAVTPGFVVSNLRGKGEEERSGWGMAGPVEAAGEFLREVLEGKRDGEVGRLIGRDGVYGW
ncbi:MAG: hypothetical protein Q9227_006762 [Pyrenula ochraceoflavens]